MLRGRGTRKGTGAANAAPVRSAAPPRPSGRRPVLAALGLAALLQLVVVPLYENAQFIDRLRQLLEPAEQVLRGGGRGAGGGRRPRGRLALLRQPAQQREQGRHVGLPDRGSGRRGRRG